MHPTRTIDAREPDQHPSEPSADSSRRGRVGQVLCNKWRLDALLGAGGMASVYAATHRNGRRAAIKLLHDTAARDPGIVARFLREGYVANAVGHPGAVGVLDDDVAEDGSAMLVMELLEGETLEARLDREGRLGVDEALSIADELCDILAAAHERGIVHRDVKPANVFVETSGRVRLLDFGIARLASINGDTTQTGVVLGTPAFMPPEQVRASAGTIGPRSDLWAVGAILFSALAGRDVHEADSAADLLMAAAFEHAPPLAAHAPDVPPRVAAIVDRALRFDPAERWSDARAMQKAIREAREALFHESEAAPAGPHALELDPTDDSATVRLAPGNVQAPSRPEAGSRSDDATECTPCLVSMPPPVATPRTAPARRDLGRWIVATAAALAMLTVKVTVLSALLSQVCAWAVAARDLREPVAIVAARR